MNKKISFLLVFVLSLTLFLFIKSIRYPLEITPQKQSQSLVIGQAATPTPTTGACSTPAQVQNVLVSFPNCVGDTCDFTKASCSWGATVGASKYSVKVSVVETGAIVRNDQVEAAVTSVTFNVAQSNTYKCEIAAINSCGTSGPAGSHSLFCKIDVPITLTPTPAPTSPAPKNECGFSCTSDDQCKTGFACAIGSNGQGFCSLPQQLSVCTSSPTVSNCCSKPTVPPAGGATTTIVASLGAVIFVILGLALFLW